MKTAFPTLVLLEIPFAVIPTFHVFSEIFIHLFLLVIETCFFFIFVSVSVCVSVHVFGFMVAGHSDNDWLVVRILSILHHDACKQFFLTKNTLVIDK